MLAYKYAYDKDDECSAKTRKRTFSPSYCSLNKVAKMMKMYVFDYVFEIGKQKRFFMY